jgi:HD-like signal output (HDOD) protein
MSLLDWFSQLFSSRKKAVATGAPPAPIRLTRAAAVRDQPFDIFTALGTEYDAALRKPPAVDAPEVPLLVSAVRDCVASHKVTLPSFPPLAAQVFGTIEHPDFEMNQLVQLVRRDPAIAAEVLSVANSMLFAAAEPLENIRDAVVRLGARQTAQAVSAISARELFDLESRGSQELFADLWQRLWNHAMVCGFTSSWAAMVLRKGDLDRLFLAGMLHDIGKSLGLRALSSLFLAGMKPVPEEILHAVLEEVHVELAMPVARSWHLTDNVLMIINDHHAPQVNDDSARVVQLVSALKEIRSNPYHREGLREEVEQAVTALRLTDQQVKALLTQLKESGQRVKSLV